MIAAGFGFRQRATAQSLLNAYAKAANEAVVDVLAAPTDKTEAQAFMDTSNRLGLPVVAIQDIVLRAQNTSTCSAASQAARGTGSVAEASALAAAGPGARLLAPRVISDDTLATCALAISEAP